MGKKEQRERIITGAAVAAFIFLAISTFSKMGAKKAAAPPVPAQSPDIAVTQTPKKPADAQKKDQEWGRDPFILGKLTAGEGIGLALNGIIWDATEPYAIINDEVVRRGDRIGGCKVVDIKEDRVILDNGTEQITLNVWE